ncbi:MAG: ATP phosphoribosyltransferase [Gemmatimonas sp.]|nr:ATP phosphoribosyltransferase [Gemmatimonas sp.]
MRSALRIALPKGRMLEDALEIWARLGSGVAEGHANSRRLILPSADGRFEFLPVKSQDVPAYVEAGVADAGVVGYDVLYEQQPDVLQPLDLGFGVCRVVVAAPEGVLYPHLAGAVTPRVATKYVDTSRRFFASRGLQVDVLHIAGSVEIAPLLGLAHWILDLVETGRTLKENGLVVVDTVIESSARLIVNRASHKLRLEEHQRLIAELESIVAEPVAARTSARG